MSTSDIAQRLEPIFRRVFRNVEFDINRSMADTADWNSLRHIQLLSGIEKQFGVEFDPTQVAKLTSLQALVDFLSERA